MKTNEITHYLSFEKFNSLFQKLYTISFTSSLATYHIFWICVLSPQIWCCSLGSLFKNNTSLTWNFCMLFKSVQSRFQIFFSPSVIVMHLSFDIRYIFAFVVHNNLKKETCMEVVNNNSSLKASFQDTIWTRAPTSFTVLSSERSRSVVN